MKMYSNIALAQARRDLQYMKDTYGMPQDFCGSFCNCDKFEGILSGEYTIKEVIIYYIEYYFNNGICDERCNGCSSNIKPNMEDIRTRKIAERYYIVV